ncbi:unnamed protein product [Moneuplotes crassus]|uniref:Uncharacterized protein n=1 Tax=Euplotes crassus TaxID=5936 RepID=A0AAD2D976_EUPCR|nr:unnamed protein product [Moneuplotes crassus]
MFSKAKSFLSSKFLAPVGVLGLAASGLELIFSEPSHHNMNLSIGFTVASPFMAVHAINIRPKNYALSACWMINGAVYCILAKDSAKNYKTVREEQQRIAEKYFKNCVISSSVQKELTGQNRDFKA